MLQGTQGAKVNVAAVHIQMPGVDMADAEQYAFHSYLGRVQVGQVAVADEDALRTQGVAGEVFVGVALVRARWHMACFLLDEAQVARYEECRVAVRDALLSYVHPEILQENLVQNKGYLQAYLRTINYVRILQYNYIIDK